MTLIELNIKDNYNIIKSLDFNTGYLITFTDEKNREIKITLKNKHMLDLYKIIAWYLRQCHYICEKCWIKAREEGSK